MASIPVVLLFECGPHNQLGGQNRTLRVLDQLRTNPTAPGIIACFFVQTHAVFGETPLRMNSFAGLQACQAMHAAKHVIGLSSGSSIDNLPHERRVLQGSPPPNPQNGLELDLRRATEAIQQSFQVMPPFYVHSLTGAWSVPIGTVYDRLQLRNIVENVDSGNSQFLDHDSLFGAVADLLGVPFQFNVVRDRLLKEISDRLRDKPSFLIIRFRDTARVTADRLSDLIAAIAGASADLQFVKTPGDLDKVLQRSLKLREEIVLKDAAGKEVLENGYVYIDEQAQMPQLSASLRTAQAFDVEWRVKIEYRRSGRKDSDTYPLVGPTVLHGNKTWHLNAEFGTDVRGGEAVIRVRGRGAGADFEGERRFRIRARNPLDADVETLIGTTPWFARYVARHESRGPKTPPAFTFYNQFNESGAHGLGASDSLHTPNASGDHGFGIFQLTNMYDPANPGVSRLPTAQELWSWKQNVTTGVKELQRHLHNANRLMNAPKLTPGDPITGSPPFPDGGWRVQAGPANKVPVKKEGDKDNVEFKDGTARVIEDAVAMKRFNGASGGDYCEWDKTKKAWQFHPLNTLNPPFNYVNLVCNEVTEE